MVKTKGSKEGKEILISGETGLQEVDNKVSGTYVRVRPVKKHKKGTR